MLGSFDRCGHILAHENIYSNVNVVKQLVLCEYKDYNIISMWIILVNVKHFNLV